MAGPGICSPEKEKSERARLPSAQDSDPSWESFLGSSKEKTNILIRWPDGSRDSFAQPADTKLRSLLLFISTKVSPDGNFEAIRLTVEFFVIAGLQPEPLRGGDQLSQETD